ncbi:MAG: hypothetical protein JW910_04565, partial [Anaerolineae bacterium]|nr:hypothetical protein [Anaerolineae bacterium]
EPGEVSGVWEACPYCLRGGLPPWVDFHYYWLLTDDAGNTYETVPEHGIYEDNTREWNVLDRDDITLYWFGYDPEFGELMADAMTQFSANMEIAWGRTLSYTPIAIMFPDGEVWNEYVEGGVNPNAAGFTDSSTGFTVLRPAQPRDPLRQDELRSLCGGYWYGDRPNTPEEWALEDTLHTVLHEFTHLYQADFRTRGPFWWTEGEADFFANAALTWRNRDSDSRMMNWGAMGYDLITLQGGGPSGGSTTSADGCHALGYAVGDSFIRWLVDNYGGLEIHYTVLENIPGNGVESALEIATGVSFNELENQYRAAFGIAPVSVQPTATPFVFPTAPIPSIPTSPPSG